MLSNNSKIIIVLYLYSTIPSLCNGALLIVIMLIILWFGNCFIINQWLSVVTQSNLAPLIFPHSEFYSKSISPKQVHSHAMRAEPTKFKHFVTIIYTLFCLTVYASPNVLSTFQFCSPRKNVPELDLWASLTGGMTT